MQFILLSVTLGFLHSIYPVPQMTMRLVRVIFSEEEEPGVHRPDIRLLHLVEQLFQLIHQADRTSSRIRSEYRNRDKDA